MAMSLDACICFRPKRKPPPPANVDSWAITHINLRRDDRPEREVTQLSLSRLRSDLIGARHVLGEADNANAEDVYGKSQYSHHNPSRFSGRSHELLEINQAGDELQGAQRLLTAPRLSRCHEQSPLINAPLEGIGAAAKASFASLPKWGQVPGPDPIAAAHSRSVATAQQPAARNQQPMAQPARVQSSLKPSAAGDWDPDLLAGLDDLDDGLGVGSDVVARPRTSASGPRQAPQLPTTHAAAAGAKANDGKHGGCGPQRPSKQPATSSNGRWWDELNDFLVPRVPDCLPHEPATAPAARKAGGELRQAKLTADGRCAVPPPPPPGAAWRLARPGGLAGPGDKECATTSGSGAELPASAQRQNQQEQPRLRQAQLPFPNAESQGKEPVQGAAAAAGSHPTGGKSAAAAATVGVAGAATVAAGGRKRPHSATGPVSEEEERPAGLQQSADGPAPGGGGSAAAAGSRAKKKAGKTAGDGPTHALMAQLQALCEALDDAVEGGSGQAVAPQGREPAAQCAHSHAVVRDASDPKVASELRARIAGSRLLVVGVLMAVCEGPVYQYASNVQPLSKVQRDCLLKAKRLLAKGPSSAAALTAQEPAATSTPRRPADALSHAGAPERSGDGRRGLPQPPGGGCYPGAGILASEHLERCVALCVICLDERQCEEMLSPVAAAAVRAGGGPGGGGDGAASALDGALLYLLRTTAWPPRVLDSVAPRRQPLARTALLSLLDELLVRAPCPTLCCNSKALLRETLALGWHSPPPAGLRLMDPCTLAWMEAPQLAQRDEKEIECYNLETLCPRYGINLAYHAGPLARMRCGLLATGRLFEAVRLRVQPWLRPQAVQVEMQVSWVLAHMESLGIAVDAAGLGRNAAAVRRRMDALSAAASSLLGGRQVNLGSSAQLAVILYEDLGLPPPAQVGQRDGGTGKDRYGRARTHLTTDEAALKQVASLHPLPGLVLQYRSLQNVLSKWLEPDWLPPLLARSGLGPALSGRPGPFGPAASMGAGTGSSGEVAPGPLLPRLSCCWNQTATATGRLSSSSPNMQAVTKYEVLVQLDSSAADGSDPQAGAADAGSGAPTGAGPQQEEAGARGAVLRVVARDAFVAPAGRLLVSADYSQIELRLLAHLSGDLRLQDLLRRGGEKGGGGDAFRHIAAAWLRPGTAPADISSRDREQVKRVVYGIIYGMTPQGLAQQLAEHGMGLEDATALRSSFLRHFAGVQAFITSSLHHARRNGYITTGLLGRRRPIAGLTSSDPRVRGDAERKGSAADLMKCAMCMWASYQHPDTRREPPHAPGPNDLLADCAAGLAPGCGQHVGNALTGRPTTSAPLCLPPCNAELVAQIHDELMFECDARPEAVRQLVATVRSAMCDVVRLHVPLLVKVAAGQCWGGLKELPEDLQLAMA